MFISYLLRWNFEKLWLNLNWWNTGDLKMLFNRCPILKSWLFENQKKNRWLKFVVSEPITLWLDEMVMPSVNGWTDFKSKPRYKKTMIEPIIHETDYKVPAATKTSTLHFCKQLISKFDGTNRTRLNSFQAQIWDYNGWAMTLILSWRKQKENAMSVQMLAAFWKSNK